VAGEARNQDALSEEVGQVMELALLRGDRRMFERQFAPIRDKFQGKPGGFLAWKITLDPFKRADTSATLDDWRVIWACRPAAKRWGLGEVDKFARALAEELAAELQTVLGGLASLRERSSEVLPGGTRVDFDKLLPLYDRLEKLLRQSDARASKTAVEIEGLFSGAATMPPSSRKFRAQ
jgi:hypothetical protein